MKISKFEILVLINIILLGIIIVLSNIIKDKDYDYESIVYSKEYLSEEVKEKVEEIKEEKRLEEIEK